LKGRERSGGGGEKDGGEEGVHPRREERGERRSEVKNIKKTIKEGGGDGVRGVI